MVELADRFRPDWYRPLLLTAAYVGPRWGDLAGLDVEHVDPLRRVIRIERQLVEVNGRVHFGPPKTKAGRRTVTMPGAIAELLGAYMGSPAVRASGLVFPTLTGQPMRRYGGLFPSLDEAIAEGLDGVLRRSLGYADADRMRTSEPQVTGFRRSAP